MKYLLIIFVFSSICLSAQTLTREEAIEDIDYFYNMFKCHHPNPYYYTPQSIIDSIIEDFRGKCYDSMPVADFRYYFSHLNYLFDYHSGCSIRQHGVTMSDRLFPQVYFQDHKVRLVKNDWEVLSINSVPVDSIVARVRMNFGAEVNRRYFEFLICLNYEFQGGVIDFGFDKPPFTVRCRTLENRDTTIVLEGETKKSLRTAQEVFYKDCHRCRFELYPEDKIAIIRYGDVFRKESFGGIDTLLNNFFQDCCRQDICHLFFDVSRNDGGYIRGFSYFFPFLQINRKKSYRHRVKDYDWEHEQILDGKTIKSPNGILPFKGNVYVYQSFFSQSSTSDFCACMKVLADAILVGTETGSGLPLYGNYKTFYLPNTGDEFTVSASCFKDEYPKLPRTPEGYLLPDIEYPMLTDRLLNVEDCRKIIEKNRRTK